MTERKTPKFIDWKREYADLQESFARSRADLRTAENSIAALTRQLGEARAKVSEIDAERCRNIRDADAAITAAAKALHGVLAVAPTSADMRLLIRAVGGVSKTAEEAIAQFDKLDGAVDAARAALSAPDAKERK